MQKNIKSPEGKKIIAIVGMCGSGKSEVVNYLQKTRKWPKIYFGEATFDRIKKEGLEINYENEKKIREKIRKEMGMDAYAKLALPKIEKILKEHNILILESLYSWDEYKIIKEKYKNNFKVIAVFSSPKTRLKRMLGRQEERPMKNEEEFIKRDYSEIENTDKGGPIARADFTIINESSLEDFHHQLENIINNIQL
jgi:dephospho-CoA kinase